MKIIPLTHGQRALVDDDEYEHLAKHKWHVNAYGYAVTWIDRRIVFMHRKIIGAEKGQLVDHVNHQTTDNRRSNLRLCTRSQNAMNMKRRKGRSKFKGVFWADHARRWRARITVNYKAIYLGYFDSELEAALAAARNHFREFALLNF
jgi:hypothetical protein